MNLTTRSKWLTAIAALVVGYVVFGPKDSDSVEPVRTAPSAAAHAAHAAAASPSSVPVARSLLRLAQRVVDQTSAGSLFAAHSWYVAPPPPPPVEVSIAPVEAVKPVAPPLPFTYMGSYAPNGAKPVFFLTQGDRVYDVHIGDTLDGTYTVDSFTNGALVFTYKPLNQQQQLTTGGAP
jgi:hypothetical protein